MAGVVHAGVPDHPVLVVNLFVVCWLRCMVGWGRGVVGGRFVVCRGRGSVRCRLMVGRNRGVVRGRFMVGRSGWSIGGRLMVCWDRSMVGCRLMVGRCWRGVGRRLMVCRSRGVVGLGGVGWGGGAVGGGRGGGEVAELGEPLDPGVPLLLALLLALLRDSLAVEGAEAADFSPELVQLGQEALVRGHRGQAAEQEVGECLHTLSTAGYSWPSNFEHFLKRGGRGVLSPKF